MPREACPTDIAYTIIDDQLIVITRGKLIQFANGFRRFFFTRKYEKFLKAFFDVGKMALLISQWYRIVLCNLKPCVDLFGAFLVILGAIHDNT